MVPASLRCLWGDTADKVPSSRRRWARSCSLRSCFGGLALVGAQLKESLFGELGLQTHPLRARRGGGVEGSVHGHLLCPGAILLLAFCPGSELTEGRLRIRWLAEKGVSYGSSGVRSPDPLRLVRLFSLYKQSKETTSQRGKLLPQVTQLQKASAGVWTLLGLARVAAHLRTYVIPRNQVGGGGGGGGGGKCGPRQAPSALPVRPPLVFYVSLSMCLSFYMNLGMVTPEASSAQSITVWPVCPLI